MLIPLFSFYECLKLRKMSIFLGWGLGGGGGVIYFFWGGGRQWERKGWWGDAPHYPVLRVHSDRLSFLVLQVSKGITMKCNHLVKSCWT